MPPAEVDRALRREPADVGSALLDCAEDQWFDRKSARIASKSLANILVAMGNAEGGVIAIGLSKGVVEGTDHIGDRNGLMQAHLDFTEPPVRAHCRLVDCVTTLGHPDHLLIIDVSPSEGVVHATVRDEVYLRVGDESRRLTFLQRQELYFDRSHDTYETRPVPGSSLGDIDHDLVERYAAALEAPDVERLLVARGLMRDGTLNVAGMLLFGAEPQAHFPETHVRVLKYRGTERGSGHRQQLALDERIEGPIPRMLVAARRLVTDHQSRRRALGPKGTFEDVPLVPEDAWLEGLVNAVVHRSYSVGGDHIRVELFDDRIEISSPGRFPGLVDLSTPFEAPRFARNPRIARVCADLRFGQELGEGIRRIYDEMRLAGLKDPIYRQTAASVRLTLSAEPKDRELDAKLVPEARAISAALRDAGRLGTGELAALVGRSRPTVLKTLRQLEKAGIVRWVGRSPRDPRAYWEFIRRRNGLEVDSK